MTRMVMAALALVRRRSAQLISLHAKWGRQSAYFHTQRQEDESALELLSSKDPNAQERDTKSSVGQNANTDPFGLEYLGLESIVQGLYSKTEGNANASGENPVEISVEEKYKDWFAKSTPNIIDSESELVRSTTFGSIRFDSDNAARMEDEDDPLPAVSRRTLKTKMENESSPPTQVRKIEDEDGPLPVSRRLLKTKMVDEPTPPTQDRKVSSRPLTTSGSIRFDSDNTARMEDRDGPLPVSRRPLKTKVEDESSPPTQARKIEDEDGPLPVSRRLLKTKMEDESSPPTQVRKVSRRPLTAFGSIRSDSDNAARMENKDGPLPVSRRPLKTKVKDESSPPTQDRKMEDDDEDDPLPAVVSRRPLKTKMEDESPPPTQVRKVPKIYETPNYNFITHDDMWNVIKHCVVFQNDFILAINKPYGLPMHSPAVECRHTVIEFLDELAKLSNCEKVYPLHRLDKETTGVLLLAKSEQSAEIIKKKFKDRLISKTYLTITKCCPKLNYGTIKIPISEGKVGGTDNYRSKLKPDLTAYNIRTKQSFAKEAITEFKILGSNEDCAFLEIRAQTGIKHQVRVHLAMGLGCPILGDHKYSHIDKLAPQRLSAGMLDSLKISQSKVRDLPIHLHCSQIKFNMPEGFSPNCKEPVFITCRPPAFFMHSLNKLRLR